MHRDHQNERYRKEHPPFEQMKRAMRQAGTIFA
jgi:hypothetical protein